MSGELQPFDSHPASPGDLQAGADNLVQQGAEALQNADQTEQAYSPALDAVTGEPGPAVAQASDPVKAKSLAGSESLVWAGVATRYWSQKVRTFNQQVEIIKVDRFNAMNAADDAAATSTLPPAEVTQQADDAKAAADAAARERWYRVYNEEIVSGRAVVQTWLSRGPTEEYMQVARDVGAMPDLRWGPLEALWKGIFGTSTDDSGVPVEDIVGGAGAAAAGRGRGRGRFGSGGKGVPPRGEPLPRWTNKQARDAAARHGYRDTGKLTGGNDPQKIFYNPKTKRYISPDVGSGGDSGSHIGGRWKMATSEDRLRSRETRLGTYDEDLNRIGD